MIGDTIELVVLLEGKGPNLLSPEARNEEGLKSKTT